MKTKIMLVSLIGIIVVLGVTFAEQNRGAKEFVISNSKGDVPFPHHGHQEVLGMDHCNLCHDVFPQKSGAISELKAQGKLEKKQVMNKQCIKCHNEKKKDGVKSGPTTCSGCHK